MIFTLIFVAASVVSSAYFWTHLPASLFMSVPLGVCLSACDLFSIFLMSALAAALMRGPVEY